MNELPGFSTPLPLKEMDRIMAPLDGHFEFTFLEGLPLDYPLDDYVIYVDLEYGSQIRNLAVLQGPAIEVRRQPNGTKSFGARLTVSEFLCWPMTYFLRVVDSAGRQIFRKSYVVRSSPFLPWQIFPNADPDSGPNPYGPVDGQLPIPGPGW